MGNQPITNSSTYLQVQEARSNHDDEAVKRSINAYEDVLGRYIPVLMAQAKIYWDLEMYPQVIISKITLMSRNYVSNNNTYII